MAVLSEDAARVGQALGVTFFETPPKMKGDLAREGMAEGGYRGVVGLAALNC